MQRNDIIDINKYIKSTMESKQINWNATILDIFEQLNNYYYSIANYGEVIKLLVKTQGVDLTNITNKEGEKINLISLMITVDSNETEEGFDLMKFIIKQGADVNYVDDDGYSLLHYACNCQLFEISEILIEHGADINITNSEGSTVLNLLRADFPNMDAGKISNFKSYLVDHGAIE